MTYVSLTLDDLDHATIDRLRGAQTRASFLRFLLREYARTTDLLDARIRVGRTLTVTDAQKEVKRNTKKGPR